MRVVRDRDHAGHRVGGRVDDADIIAAAVGDVDPFGRRQQGGPEGKESSSHEVLTIPSSERVRRRWTGLVGVRGEMAVSIRPRDLNAHWYRSWAFQDALVITHFRGRRIPPAVGAGQ